MVLIILIFDKSIYIFIINSYKFVDLLIELIHISLLTGNNFLKRCQFKFNSFLIYKKDFNSNFAFSDMNKCMSECNYTRDCENLSRCHWDVIYGQGQSLGSVWQTPRNSYLIRCRIIQIRAIFIEASWESTNFQNIKSISLHFQTL